MRIRNIRGSLSRIIGFACLVVLMPLVLTATEYKGRVKFGEVPVPGVAVTAIQGDKKVTALTDDLGVYVFPDLADGVWSVEVDMSGFGKLKQDVTVTKDASTEWTLNMLGMSEIKSVAMAATPASTEPAAAASGPATGNSKAPATPARPGAAPARPGFQRAEVNAASGAAAAATDSQPLPNEGAADLAQRAADGLLINGSVNNGAASPFAQSAAFGNNRRTRSLYNGAFGLFIDNSALDARTYSFTGDDTAKPRYNQAVANFSFGGPLKIPRLMRVGPNFFFTYQRTQNRNADTRAGLVPTLAERNGDLSASGGPIIPQNEISPQARALVALYPLPNTTVKNGGRVFNYQIPIVGATHQDALQGRLQKAVSIRNQLAGDFAMQRTVTDNPTLLGFLGATQTLGMNGSVNWTHRTGQRFSTNLRYQFSRLRNRVTSNFGNKRNVSGEAGINGNNQDSLYWGPPTLNFANGISSLSDAQPVFNRNLTHTFSYSSLWNHSPHSFNFGGDFRRQQMNVLSQQDPRGTFTFTSATLEDFLRGIPTTSSISYGNADKYYRQAVYDAFITDDWRVRTGLTLNLGVRWDYEAPIVEKYDRLVNLDVAKDFSTAKPITGSNTIHGNKYGIQPRLALAWRPFPASSLVVRAGYGVYRNTTVYQSIVAQMAQQAPFSKNGSAQNSPATPLTLANGFNAAPISANTFGVDPNFRIGYAQTWNVTAQRDLPASLQMNATYTGTKGTRLLQEILPNTYPNGVVNPCPTCPTGFAYLTSNGNSTRHSGQVQLRRRLHNGFTANVSYTLSKSIDNAGFTGPSSLIAQNFLDLRAERALSGFDQRHLVNSQLQYTTGMGTRGGMLMGGWRGAIFKEWTAVANLTSGSGLPLTPIYPAPVKGISGSVRPNYNGGPALSATSYSAPSPGQWGNAGRHSITGPRQFSLNASVSRTIRTGDRINTDIKIDALNVLNHVTYPNFNTTVTSAQFGVPTAANQMRKIQTTLRMRF